MCGRFAVTTDPALLADKIRAIDEASLAARDAAGETHPGAAPGPNYNSPNYNVAPTTAVATVTCRRRRRDSNGDRDGRSDDSGAIAGTGARRVRLMRWGLVPSWAKTAAGGGPDTRGPLLINARAEKVTTSPAFRSSAKSRRCLVPMDGWYEWRPDPAATPPSSQIRKASKTPRTPFFMNARDGEPLFMAGVWTAWRADGAPRTAAPLLSCTIITTEAAGPLADIHDRMPLTISEPDWDRWLDPDAPMDEGLLRGHGDLARIDIREVSRLVNSVRNNGPELIEPVG